MRCVTGHFLPLKFSKKYMEMFSMQRQLLSDSMPGATCNSTDCGEIFCKLQFENIQCLQDHFNFAKQNHSKYKVLHLHTHTCT